MSLIFRLSTKDADSVSIDNGAIIFTVLGRLARETGLVLRGAAWTITVDSAFLNLKRCWPLPTQAICSRRQREHG